jgi:hypothetical protein
MNTIRVPVLVRRNCGYMCLYNNYTPAGQYAFTAEIYHGIHRIRIPSHYVHRRGVALVRVLVAR